jgi:hypothetical protein
MKHTVKLNWSELEEYKTGFWDDNYDKHVHTGTFKSTFCLTPIGMFRILEKNGNYEVHSQSPHLKNSVKSLEDAKQYVQNVIQNIYNTFIEEYI